MEIAFSHANQWGTHFNIASTDLGIQMPFEQVQNIMLAFPSYSYIYCRYYILMQTHNPSGINKYLPTICKKAEFDFTEKKN